MRRSIVFCQGLKWETQKTINLDIVKMQEVIQVAFQVIYFIYLLHTFIYVQCIFSEGKYKSSQIPSLINIPSLAVYYFVSRRFMFLLQCKQDVFKSRESVHINLPNSISCCQHFVQVFAWFFFFTCRANFVQLWPENSIYLWRKTLVVKIMLSA